MSRKIDTVIGFLRRHCHYVVVFRGEKTLLFNRAILHYLYIIQRFRKKVNNMRQSGESTGCGRGARAGEAGSHAGKWLGVVPFRGVRVRSRLGLDFARDDGTKERYAWFAGGRGVRPYHALSKVSTGIVYLSAAAPRRADEERPYQALSIVIFATFITSFRPKR